MTLAKSVKIGARTIDIPVTIADQIVNYFNPTKGAERFQSRLRMAFSGGYTGADRTRRANMAGYKREMDADTAILPDLGTLREESQHLIRNNAIAGGAIKTNISKVVGTGLKVKAQLDRDVLNLTDDQADAWERKAEREFRLATESREIDAERQLPFSLLQGLAFLKSLEDGDIFISMPRFKRAGSPYSLKLQLIEAARVCNKDGKPDTVRLCGGVEKDATGASVNFHVLNQHPGNWRHYPNKQKTWKVLPAFGKSTGMPSVIQLFDKTRPGQTRGVPYLAPVVELIKQLGRYTDAEVMAAVVSGMLTVFVTNETGSPEMSSSLSEDSNPNDTNGMELGYGSVVGLLPGEKVESVNPGRPNTAFDPFVVAILRQVGMALEIPFELLVKHFTASYSAARAAMEEAWDYFNRRRHWLATMLCQPVYEAVISEAIATGRLAAPGFFSDPMVKKAWLGTVWTGDAPGQLDPLKEINAAAKRVEQTISTLAEESIRLTGTSWEDKLPQILKERAILRKAGISISAYEQVVVETEPEPPVNEDKADTEEE